MKKTVAEAEQFYRSIVLSIADPLGLAVSFPSFDNYVKLGYSIDVKVPFGDEWFLKFSPSLRVQGDESRYMWEPNDGDRGTGWKGDWVQVEYNKEGTVHDCPLCECAHENSIYGHLYDLKDVTDFLERVKAVRR